MTLSTLLKSLRAHADAAVGLQLSDRSTVPAHFHITEVGRVRKQFIDCGGTVRSLDRCVLQVWVADDLAHRVQAGKLAKIIGLARPILGEEDLELEVEYDLGVITQLPVTAIHSTAADIVLTLGTKHTACLAPDRCGVADSNCSTPGCCAPATESPLPLSIGCRK